MINFLFQLILENINKDQNFILMMVMLSVFLQLDRKINSVTLQGNVFRPGDYSLSKYSD